MWIKKERGKIIGLPPEPSKTCSFRKCNIPLFTIVWKKIFKVQQMPKNKEKINENMHTCFHWLSAMSIQKIWKEIAGYLLKSAYIILSSQVK